MFFAIPFTRTDNFNLSVAVRFNSRSAALFHPAAHPYFLALERLEIQPRSLERRHHAP